MEEKLTAWIDAHQQKMEQDLLELIAIESTEAAPTPQSPFGDGVGEALTKIAHIGRRLGFQSHNHQGYYTTIDWGAVTQPRQAVGILCHMDVVPFGEGWAHSPLGEIVGSRIYGRGALDDKGPAVASLYAMAALKANGVKLSRPIRLVAGGNEESGCLCMAHYKQTDTPLWGGFSPDGNFPVIFAEKGIALQQGEVTISSSLIHSIDAGTAVNAVPGKAEAILNTADPAELSQRLSAFSQQGKIHCTPMGQQQLHVTAIGKSAHGSTPEQGENAIKLLIDALRFLDISDPLLSLLTKLNDLFCADPYGQAAGIAVRDEISGSLTLNLGILRYHEEQLHLELDLRYPVTCSYPPIQAALAEKLTPLALTFTCTEHKPPLYVDKEAPLVRTLAEIYRQTGRRDTEPLAIGGGTYCRSMDHFVAFGPVGADDADTMHRADEYLEREHLRFLTKIYAQALYQLAK